MKAIIRTLFFVFAGSFLLSSCYKTTPYGPSLTPFDTTYSAAGGYIKGCLGTSLKVTAGSFSLHERTTLPNAKDILYTVNTEAKNLNLLDTVKGYTYKANGNSSIQFTFYNGQNNGLNSDSTHLWLGYTIKIVPTNGGNGGNPLFVQVKVRVDPWTGNTTPKIDLAVGDPNNNGCQLSTKP